MATNKPNLSRVWASDAESSKVVDPDTTFADKYISGYTAEQPYYEHFNFLFNQFSAALAHNNEQGINLWDSETTYPIGAYAKANSSLYTAISENTNIDPTTDGGTNWVPFVIGPFSASGNSAGLNTSTPLLANGDAGAVFQILSDTRSAFRGTVSGGGGDVELRAFGGGNAHLVNFGSSDLNIGTAGSTSMTFYGDGTANYSGGNFGIGTDTPLGDAHVLRGNSVGGAALAASQNTLIVENGDTSSGIAIKANSTDRSRLFFCNETSNIASGFDYNHATNRLDIYSNSLVQASIDSDGYLGLGTTSPLGIFHSLESDAINYFESPGISSVGLQFRTNGTNRYRIETPTSSADLRFLAGGTTEVLRLTSTGEASFAGDVSIGTALFAETGKLNVTQAQNNIVDGTFTDAHIALVNTTAINTNGFTGVTYSTSNIDNYGWSVGSQRTSTSGVISSFIWRNHNNSAVGSELMALTHEGNLGVGNTAPPNMLSLGNSTTGAEFYLAGKTATSNDYLFSNTTGNYLELEVPGGTQNIMTWGPTGNIGVGTATPNTATSIQRDVATSSTASNTISTVQLVNGTASYTAGNVIGSIGWTKSGSYSNGHRAGIIAKYTNTGSQAANIGTELEFKVAAEGGGDSVAAMTVTSAGLGVGTNAPGSYSFQTGTKVAIGAGDDFSTVSIVSSTTTSGYLAFADGTTGDERFRGLIQYDHSTDEMLFRASGLTYSKISTPAAGETALWLYDADNATLERVTVGAADTGGAGFKVLRIPN